MHFRKTRLMHQIEERYKQPLEVLLPALYNEKGLIAMAEELGLSRSTVWYWLLRFGIEIRHVAIPPGQVLEVKLPSNIPSKT